VHNGAGARVEAPPFRSRLYAIVDVEICAHRGWAPRDLARAYLAGGATLLQLRAKSLGGAAFLDLAASLVADAREAYATVIVNDRADLAALSGAAGVHVGQEDLAPADARRVVGEAAIVGLSTHTNEQIEEALTAPISYLAIGPVFATGTKATGYDSVGYAAVAHASARGATRGLPVVAIGGITLAAAPQVIAAGAAAVAVITDLMHGDPEQRVREYVRRLSGV
jgi:thiamine-phosphate pyrophosphorylase